MRLFPAITVGQEQHVKVVSEAGLSWRLILTVKESYRYTAVVVLDQEFGSSRWLPNVQMELKVYHDVRMVEVVGYQGHRRMQAKNNYPNANMYHRDEKSQLGQLLTESLVLAQ